MREHMVCTESVDMTTLFTLPNCPGLYTETIRRTRDSRILGCYTPFSIRRKSIRLTTPFLRSILTTILAEWALSANLGATATREWWRGRFPRGRRRSLPSFARLGCLFGPMVRAYHPRHRLDRRGRRV